jgi:Heterokaryon incompatibility protein (HET)
MSDKHQTVFNSTIFQYEPLSRDHSEIRLLELDATSSNSEHISCTMFNWELGSERQTIDFVALSYMWGDPSITEDILVNGMVFPITQNLASALMQIASSSSTQTFAIWVDAICINQADMIERSHQISLMRKIFKGAGYVHAWIGPSSDTSQRAIELLEKLENVSLELSDRFPGVEKLEYMVGLIEPGEFSDIWKELDTNFESIL